MIAASAAAAGDGSARCLLASVIAASAAAAAAAAGDGSARCLLA